MDQHKRIVVGITGASGVIYGIRLLEVLAEDPLIKTNLVISPSGYKTISLETSYSAEQVCSLADVVHDFHDIGAPIASGSFPVDGMIVAPCSIKTLSGISISYADNLLSRAADVQLKEGRPLILVVRETPLHSGHLKRMLEVSEMGAIIMPPMPNWYAKPKTLDELVELTVKHILRRFGLSVPGVFEWDGGK